MTRETMDRIDGRMIEMANRHELISMALKMGFNAFQPIIDQGIDFILHREGDQKLIKVQLKSRFRLDKKYEGRDLWMAFPSGDQWYLIPCDTLLSYADECLIGTRSKKREIYSWRNRLNHHSAEIPKTMRPKMEEFKLQSALR